VSGSQRLAAPSSCADLPLAHPPQEIPKERIMDIPILMPQLGNEIEEAQIDGWLKAVGEIVAEGEQILTITTPKVTMEIEAPASGVLKEILVPADELALVGATLGIISKP
jgi:pyruvate/2-oxoglutarate dehydrogenase complex dihydrolipoamide acyltransferase (E2) component